MVQHEFIHIHPTVLIQNEKIHIHSLAGLHLGLAMKERVSQLNDRA